MTEAGTIISVSERCGCDAQSYSADVMMCKDRLADEANESRSAGAVPSYSSASRCGSIPPAAITSHMDGRREYLAGWGSGIHYGTGTMILIHIAQESSTSASHSRSTRPCSGTQKEHFTEPATDSSV